MPEVETVLEYDGRYFTLRYADLFPKQTDEELAALDESIKKHGVLDGVKHTPDDIVIDGGTRLQRAKKLGIPLKDVPLIEMQLSDDEALEAAVFLNAARRQLTKEHRVLLAHRLRRRGMTIAKIADALGRSVTRVHGYLSEPDPEGDSQSPSIIQGADGKMYPTKKPRESLDGDTSSSFSGAEKLDGAEEPEIVEGDGQEDDAPEMEDGSDKPGKPRAKEKKDTTPQAPADPAKLRKEFAHAIQTAALKANQIGPEVYKKVQPLLQKAFDIVHNIPSL
jgi:ParB-like chromosome segregation protein Spo0J